MQILLEIKQPQDFEALIPLLNRLKIKFIRTDEHTSIPENQNQKSPNKQAVPEGKSDWDFQKFYAIAKTNANLDELDQRLNENRKEWERDTF